VHGIRQKILAGHLPKENCLHDMARPRHPRGLRGM
jgi:hypothetical protein